MSEKKWVKSKMLWFNLVTTILMVSSLSDFATLISPKWLAVINGVGNIVLRVWFTNSKLN